MTIHNPQVRKKTSILALSSLFFLFSSCAIETGNPLAGGKKPKKQQEIVPSEVIQRSYASCHLTEESVDKKSAVFSCDLFDDLTKSSLPMDSLSSRTQWQVSATPDVKIDPLTSPSGSQFEFRLSVVGEGKATAAIGKVKLSVATTPKDTNTPINVDRFTIKNPESALALWDYYLSDDTWDTFAGRSKLNEISYSCVESLSLCSQNDNPSCGSGGLLPYIVYFKENQIFLMVKRRKEIPLTAHQIAEARFKETNYKFDAASLVLWIDDIQFFNGRYFKCSKGYKAPADLPEENDQT